TWHTPQKKVVPSYHLVSRIASFQTARGMPGRRKRSMMAERAGKEAHGMEITILDSLEHLRTRAGAALPGQHGRRHACLPLPDGSYYISFLHYDAGKGLEQRLEILCTR